MAADSDEKGRDASIAEALVQSYAADAPLTIAPGHDLPSPLEVRAAVTELRELIFPGFTGGARPASGVSLRSHVAARVAQVRVRLTEQIYRGLHHRCRVVGADCTACEEAAERITDGLIAGLPEVRALLMTDVRAAFEGDPAATGVDEIVPRYPGLVRHRHLSRRAPALPARRRDRAAHADRARALAHRHRHPSRRRPSANRSSSTTVPASSSARPR